MRQSSIATNGRPSSVMPTAPQNATTMAGLRRPIRRVRISRSAAASAEAAPTTAQMSNAEGTGLITSSAPAKPTPIALQRRQPTASPNSKTDSAVIRSGAICRTAATLASCMWASATMKPAVDSPSQTERHAKSRQAHQRAWLRAHVPSPASPPPAVPKLIVAPEEVVSPGWYCWMFCSTTRRDCRPPSTQNRQDAALVVAQG